MGKSKIRTVAPPETGDSRVLIPLTVTLNIDLFYRLK